MGIKLFNCDCEYKELSGIGTAKGYALEKECDICKSKREQRNLEITKENRKREIINELNELDKKVIRPLLDNETDRVNTIKAQKVSLREEFNTL